MDQSPMMTVHSMQIRPRWNSATTAKITPATRENVFASMSHHPKFLTQDSTQGGGGCERRANEMVTKWSQTGDHGTELNRTKWHVRPHFPIQINTYGDGTKRVERSPIKLTFRFQRS